MPLSPVPAGKPPIHEAHNSPISSFFFSSDIEIPQKNSGIGLETSILFAKEGASVLMSDISDAALEKGLAKVKQLVPSARVETKVRSRQTHLPPRPSLRVPLSHLCILTKRCSFLS